MFGVRCVWMFFVSLLSLRTSAVVACSFADEVVQAKIVLDFYNCEVFELDHIGNIYEATMMHRQLCMCERKDVCCSI